MLKKLSVHFTGDKQKGKLCYVNLFSFQYVMKWYISAQIQVSSFCSFYVIL